MGVKCTIYEDMVPGRRWGTYCTLLNIVPESENGGKMDYYGGNGAMKLRGNILHHSK